MKSTIEIARECGYWSGQTIEMNDVGLERFEALVRADERAALTKLLDGIDKTQIESDEGWWETSTGAEFGSSILKIIRARGETK